MIFVTVGHKEHDRMVRAMDAIAAGLDQQVVMQIGVRPTWLPQNAEYVKFIERADMEDYFSKAQLVVTHCTVAVLLSAKKHRKPTIMVPRMREHNEAVDDHQVGFARMLIEQNKIQGVKIIFDIDQLPAAVNQMLETKEGFTMKTAEDKNGLIKTLRDFVDNI